MPDGSTYRKTLESIEKQTGRRPKDLDGLPLPADVVHVWDWFLTLTAARGSNGFGPNPISFLDMQAWISLTGTICRPSEIEALLALDQAWLAEQARAAEIASKTKGRQ